jgi:hypothetical protein
MSSFDRLSVVVVLLFSSIPHGFGARVAEPQAAAANSDLSQRVKAEEEACVTNLRAINSAQAIYESGDPNKGFARSLKQIGPGKQGPLEPALASGKKNDYSFHLAAKPSDPSKPATHYSVVARPIKRLLDGQRSFYTDESGVIRFTTENRAPTITDSPIR